MSNANSDNPLALKVQLLEDSFNLLKPQGEALVKRFYEKLFQQHPEVKPLFSNTNIIEQRTKLLNSLVLVVNNLRKPEQLVPALSKLGEKHESYGVKPVHYHVVIQALLDVMQEFAGDLWTNELYDAWEEALNVVVSTMLKAYKGTKAEFTSNNITQETLPQRSANPNNNTHEIKETGDMETKDTSTGIDLNVLQHIVEDAEINIMVADLNETIIYVNKRTSVVMREVEQDLAKYIPGFRADNILGGSIHRFHKDPEAIKRILKSLRPGDKHEAVIRPGNMILQLNSRAIADSDGNKVAYVVEWADLTAERAQENAAARLLSSIEGAIGPIMMCDRDLKITYANPATLKMIEENIVVFQEQFRGFSLDKFVGSNIDFFHKNPSYQRQLLNNSSNLPYRSDIRVGPLTFDLNISAMSDAEGNYIGNTLEWSNVTEQRAKETDVIRLSSMIEEAETRFMVCDEDFKITYCNPSLVKLMRKYQDRIRTVLPNFDANNLIGVCIDDFHVAPAHQRRLLSDVRQLPAQAAINVAGLAFSVNATALLDAEGNRIGNAAEWIDHNDHAVYSKEIDRLYNAVLAGDLSERGNTAGMSANYIPMVQNINQIIEAIVEPIDEIKEKLGAIAQGDLKAFVMGDYKGDHASLKNALNETLGSMGELAQAAETIASGDLTVNINPKSAVDAMGHAMFQITRNLNEMLGQVQQASKEIAEGSRQIADSSQSLAQGATEQASPLEEISASIAEMSHQTDQNAGNAGLANKLATVARENAQLGDQQMREMTGAMSAIDDSSQSISKIIKVIDEIAFQTNLLALNAAVEAARAGTHGKGFAVVANEVRNLAARSAQAAKETTEMIGDSIKKVRHGIDIADKTAEALTEIVSSIGKVTDLVSEIAAASKEQAAGISQINTGLTQIEQVTQQNSSNSEQSAAAAEELSGQSIQLREQLSKFKLKEQTSAALPPGMTPEMIQSIMRYLEQQGGQFPQPQQAPTIPVHRASVTPAQHSSFQAPRGKKVDPRQVISLDDDEFGKY